MLEEEFAGGDADLAEAPGSVEKLVECVYFQRALGMVLGDEALFPRAPDGFLAVRSSGGPKSRILATLPPNRTPGFSCSHSLQMPNGGRILAVAHTTDTSVG